VAGEPYRDPQVGIEERVDDLLGRMTVEEKIAQLGSVWFTSLVDDEGFSRERARAVAPAGLGEVARISGASALLPQDSAELLNQIQRYFVEETRLGIPVLAHEEATGGFSARGATVFPQSLALGATFDAELVEEVASTIREQLLAVGARHCLAPVLDVARDPRWGRVEETFGEDPVLVGELGSAYVRGLQGDDPRRGVLATGKHFVGHTASVGGRNHAPVQLGPRDLREIHAEPFAVAIARAGLATMMNAYVSVDGLPCAGSRSILGDLLRDELGFAGPVVADYDAVSLLATYHGVAADKRDAAIRALSAGIDVELPETDCYGAPLAAAIAEGLVPLETVDAAVRRVLRAKFALGLFEQPFVDAAEAARAFDAPAHRSLARRAAARGIVVLHNTGVLPLSTRLRRIAVVGPAADDRRLLQGDYHYPASQEISYGDGSDAAEGWPGPPPRTDRWRPGPHFTEHVTPLAGIRARAAADCEVLHARGCDVTGSDTSEIPAAVDLARGCDVAVVVVGGRSGFSLWSTVGEARDAASLRLTGVQEELIRAVSATGVPTVVVVTSGRVHTLAEVADVCGALLWAAPLGEEGGAALADVLFGAVEPSGRLPVTLPRAVGQVPLHAGHRAGGGTTMNYRAYTDAPVAPLFAFGHGLSYTSFAYGDLRIDAGDTEQPLRVSVEIANAGPRNGEEVVQLYARDVVASVARPERQLIGFARVALEPGASRTVHFDVHPSRLAFYDEELRRVVEPGEFRFEAGASSDDIRCTAAVTLDGDVVAYPLTSIVPTAASVS